MLIADDDPAIVRLLADRCAGVGFVVETAVNGVQALIKAHQHHPDIVVIDVNMPEADGLKVCAHLLDPSRRALVSALNVRMWLDSSRFQARAAVAAGLQP